MIFLKASKEGPLLEIWAQPNASKTRIVGIHGSALKVAVQAPPVEGAANEEIAEFIAGLMGVPGRQVSLHRGTTSRQKFFLLTGLSLEEARQRLEGQVP